MYIARSKQFALQILGALYKLKQIMLVTNVRLVQAD